MHDTHEQGLSRLPTDPGGQNRLPDPGSQDVQRGRPRAPADGKPPQRLTRALQALDRRFGRRGQRRLNLLIGMVASLSLLLGLTHFPALHVNGSGDAWIGARAEVRITGDMLPPVPTRYDEPSPKDADAKPGEVSDDVSSVRPSGNAAADLARNLARSAGALKARATARLKVSSVRPGAVQASQLRTVRTTMPDRNAPRVHSIDIDYPRKARRAGVEGQVILEFQVNTGGRAHDIEVVQALHPSCDAEAIRAVREATFVPAQLDGRAIQATTRVAIRFVLSA